MTARPICRNCGTLATEIGADWACANRHCPVRYVGPVRPGPRPIPPPDRIMRGPYLAETRESKRRRARWQAGLPLDPETPAPRGWWRRLVDCLRGERP